MTRKGRLAPTYRKRTASDEAQARSIPIPPAPHRALHPADVLAGFPAPVVEDRGVLAWLLAAVIALSPQHHHRRLATHHHHHRPASGLFVTRRIFGQRWRSAWCVSYYESRHYLHARNGANLGPWQVNVLAHPWADPWRLTHSWWYAARAAFRISHGGVSWSAWTTHGLCGL